MAKLTAVIITLNEQENIGRCIDSLKPVADEVIVVDSFSTDRTKEIAIAKGAKFIDRAFTNYIEQKNFASSQATTDYVLNLDADECLSEALQQSVLMSKNEGFTDDAYSMNRLNFYCGKPIKTCGWYPDTKIRLWNRAKGRWIGELVHEKMDLDKGLKVAHLNGDLLHYSFSTPESLITQSDKFATLAAGQLKSERYLYLVFKAIFSPPFKFIRNYFFKLGFTDGAVGLTICINQAREVFLKYFRAIKVKSEN